MNRHLRMRFWMESLVAVMAFAFGIAAALWPHWIETILGVDPDHGSGAMEWGIVAGLLAVGMIIGLLAKRQWRRDRVLA